MKEVRHCGFQRSRMAEDPGCTYAANHEGPHSWENTATVQGKCKGSYRNRDGEWECALPLGHEGECGESYQQEQKEATEAARRGPFEPKSSIRYVGISRNPEEYHPENMPQSFTWEELAASIGRLKAELDRTVANNTWYRQENARLRDRAQKAVSEIKRLFKYLTAEEVLEFTENAEKDADGLPEEWGSLESDSQPGKPSRTFSEHEPPAEAARAALTTEQDANFASARCPRCTSTSKEMPGILLYRLRCRNCWHEWEEESLNPTLKRSNSECVTPETIAQFVQDTSPAICGQPFYNAATRETFTCELPAEHERHWSSRCGQVASKQLREALDRKAKWDAEDLAKRKEDSGNPETRSAPCGICPYCGGVDVVIPGCMISNRHCRTCKEEWGLEPDGTEGQEQCRTQGFGKGGPSYYKDRCSLPAGHEGKCSMVSIVPCAPKPRLPDGLKRRDMKVLRQIDRFDSGIGGRQLFGMVSKKRVGRLLGAGLVFTTRMDSEPLPWFNYATTPEGHTLLKEWEE